MFLEKHNFTVNPIASITGSSTPDFNVSSTSEFIVEVSTLNVSEHDKSKIKVGDAITLDHNETLRRILNKLGSDKKDQILYAAKQIKPCVLVVFNYDGMSGYGHQLYRELAEYLLGGKMALGPA